MRRAAVICALVLFAVALRAQQTAKQPVFRGGVDLVTLDVTVVDKDGQPVRGLTPADFVVTLEGQARPVRALDFLEFGRAAGSATTARETTNQPGQPQPGRRGGRVIVLLFDDLSYQPGQGKAILAAAERTLLSFDLDDQIGVATTSGLGPVVNPTRDRSAVLAGRRDKRMIGRYDDSTAPFFIAVNEAIEIDRGAPRDTLIAVANRECGVLGLPPDVCAPMIEANARSFVRQTTHRISSQMTAFQHVFDVLRQAPAPRVVIAFSRGLAVGVEMDIKSQLDPIARAAVDAGVQFYALSERPDEIDVSERSQARVTAKREEGRFLNSGIQIVASAAGGEAFLVVGQADRFFERIEAETSGFYRLGVQAPALADKRRYLATRVSVKTRGTTVRVNRQALLAAVAPASVPIADQLRAALAQGGVAFGVPIALGTAQRRDPATNAFQLAVNVQVPSSVEGPLVAMYGLVDDFGQITQERRKDVPEPTAGEDYALAFPVPIGAGSHRLRFVVADAKGNVGSVEHGVTVRLAHIGAFSVSDLFTTWFGPDGQPRFLALERLPGRALMIGATLELYPDNATGPVPDVVVRFAVSMPGQDTPLVERSITPDIVGTTRAATAELPVDDLQPGTYTIRAEVVEAGVITGTVTTTIRKTQ